MKKIAIVIFGLCVCFMANAQILRNGAYTNELDSLLKENKRQVDEIDSMVLYKTIMGNGLGYKTPIDQKYPESQYLLYFDSVGYLRKSYYWRGESDAVNTNYYNTEGNAIRCHYFTSSYDENISACLFLDKNGVKLLLDRKEKDGELLFLHIFLSEKFGILPISLVGSGVEKNIRIQSVDDLEDGLKSYEGIDSLYKPKICVPVKFISAKADDVTIVNCNSVPVYAVISGFSEPIDELDYGGIVTVLEEEEEWYKVKYSKQDTKQEEIIGYLKKEYLAPIEVTLNK